MNDRFDVSPSDLIVELDVGLLTLTLNRPDARNALSLAMLDALSAALATADADPRVRCVLLTGAGKGFCAGGDVKGMAQAGQASEAELTVAMHRQQRHQKATAGRLLAMSKPTVAAINGAAAGAGLSLALACDIRLMSSDAFLTTAFSRVGLPGDFGISYLLTQLVGTAKARELLYLSERIAAEEALRLGLVNRLVAPGELGGAGVELGRRLAEGPTLALNYMKENLNRALWADFNSCSDVEVANHVRCTLTEDHQDAVRAFAERRNPSFVGR